VSIDLGTRLADVGCGIDRAGAVLDLLGQVGDAFLKVFELLRKFVDRRSGWIADDIIAAGGRNAGGVGVVGISDTRKRDDCGDEGGRNIRRAPSAKLR